MPVGAGVAWCGVGAFMAARHALAPSSDTHMEIQTPPTGHTVPQTASIKAHPPLPPLPRPYGILDALLRLMPLGRPQGSPWRSTGAQSIAPHGRSLGFLWLFLFTNALHGAQVD